MKLFDIDNEKYHLGHLFVDAVQKNPDAINQVDAATGESETNESVLARSVQLARCLLRFGVEPGDVLAVGGRNHLDLHVPFYAAIMIGMPITGMDPTYKYPEIKPYFKLSAPRVAFCQQEIFKDHLQAIEELGLNTKLICFDDGEYSMKKFIEQYDDENGNEDFEPLDFNLDKVYAALIPTSGTSGTLKLAAMKHRTVITKFRWLDDALCLSKEHDIFMKIKREYKPMLHLAPVHWIVGFYNPLIFPLMHLTKITTSTVMPSTEHIIDIINKYKPVSDAAMEPTRAYSIMNSKKECDLTCFDYIVLIGSKAFENTLIELRKRMRPDAYIMEEYGLTENVGSALVPNPSGPLGNIGVRPCSWQQTKLVDPKTGKEVTEPNVRGELWVKGPTFTEYYKNPEETAKAFTEDGWLKTGDIMYQDAEGNHFFVERINMVIRGLYYDIIPSELEVVIREHPGVRQVGVTKITSEEDGDHPVACVVRRKGSNVTAQEIKDLVASKLPASHKLSGGVVFMDKIPTTGTGKIARGVLQKFVMTAERE